jgi:hypothetical protein
MNLSLQFNPAPKPGKQIRSKPTQRQLGEISEKVDSELKERSGSICEVQRYCRGARATERAHTIGRRLIRNKTTVNDLFHVCKNCHLWLDEQPEGIRFKRMVRETGTTAYIRRKMHAEAP